MNEYNLSEKIFEKKRFIVFEGIDGSGKDTQFYLFTKYLREKNKHLGLLLTREPTKITESGKKISLLLKKNQISKEDALKYFIQDRIEHSKIIRENLKYFYVLSTRFYLSTFLYQFAQGISFEEIFKLHKFDDKEGVIIPDIIFYLKIDLETALSRIKSRGEDIEVFENKQFINNILKSEDLVLKKLQDKFKNIIIIDGNKTPEEVHLDVIKHFKKFLLDS
jgi:dTMP kinase